MSKRLQAIMAAAAFGSIALVGAARAQNTVAVTEFLNDPNGEDDGLEWIELYNYGDQVMDVSNWAITDEDIDRWTIPDGTMIKPDNFIVLVGGSAALTPQEKVISFSRNWLHGNEDARVIGIEGDWFLSNSDDEITLTDFNGRTVWTLAYADDDVTGESTYLSDDDYSVRTYGDKSMPGVNRNGNDNNSSNFIGYETQSSNNAHDQNAYTADNGDVGSPLFSSGGPSGCLTLSINQLVAGLTTRFTIEDGIVGERAVLVYGLRAGETVVSGPLGYCATFGIDGVSPKKVIGGLNRIFDDDGMIRIDQFIPSQAKGLRIFFQAAERNTCPDECMSNLLEDVVQ